jgi:hypothetical protein
MIRLNVSKKAARFAVFLTLSAATTSAANTAELVEREASRIAQLLSTPFTVVHSDFGVAHGMPDGTVGVNIRAIERILENVPVSFHPTLIQMIVGHEVAHVNQYRRFSITSGFDSDDWKRVYEAEADIMAGYIGFQLAEAGTIDQAHNALVTCNEAARVFASLGTERFSMGRHPSRRARVTAITIGMNAAWLEKLDRQAKTGDRTARRQFQAVKKNLPFAPANITWEWRLDVAKALTHFGGQAMQNLNVERSGTKFSTDTANPVATAKYVFRNTGSRPLRVVSEVSLVFARRKNTSDIIERRRVSSSWSDFVIAPGSRSQSQNVELRWLRDEYTELGRDYVPGVFGLAHDEALWFAEFADAPQIPPPGPTQVAPESMALESGEQQTVQKWKNALQQICEAAAEKDCGRNQIVGPRVIESLFNSAGEKLYTSHSAVVGIGIPTGQVSYIWETESGAPDYLSIVVSCGDDEPYFNQTLSFLNSAISGLYADIESLPPSSKKSLWRSRSANVILELSSNKRSTRDPVSNISRLSCFIHLNIKLVRPGVPQTPVTLPQNTDLDSFLLNK